MGLFEEHPWLLVPIIIVTMECWAVVKAVAIQGYRRLRKAES